MRWDLTCYIRVRWEGVGAVPEEHDAATEAPSQ
jgi:hypothetical protein